VSGYRIAVRVKPGASRTRVGGRYDARPRPALVVAVTARAVDGKATAAVLDAVAEAFGIRRRAVRLLSGATSRDKVLELDGSPDLLDAAYQRLLG
jgi:uncharacterized protein YggU (UPF0235/DUF167 family)